MANTITEYQEIRFDLRDPDQTHVYVWIENLSKDGMLGVQGWHHKAFPASMSVMEIVNEWAKDRTAPLMWPLKSPDSRYNHGEEHD